MPVDLNEMRNVLMPGLYEWSEVSLGYAITRKAIDDNLYGNLFGKGVASPVVPLPVAVGMGVAAAVIKNPVISRRWWRKKDAV